MQQGQVADQHAGDAGLRVVTPAGRGRCPWPSRWCRRCRRDRGWRARGSSCRARARRPRGSVARPRARAGRAASVTRQSASARARRVTGRRSSSTSLRRNSARSRARSRRWRRPRSGAGASSPTRARARCAPSGRPTRDGHGVVRGPYARPRGGTGHLDRIDHASPSGSGRTPRQPPLGRRRPRRPRASAAPGSVAAQCRMTEHDHPTHGDRRSRRRRAAVGTRGPRFGPKRAPLETSATSGAPSARAMRSASGPAACPAMTTVAGSASTSSGGRAVPGGDRSGARGSEAAAPGPAIGTPPRGQRRRRPPTAARGTRRSAARARATPGGRRTTTGRAPPTTASRASARTAAPSTAARASAPRRRGPAGRRSPNRPGWCVVWLEPIPRSSTGRSAVSTIIGTPEWCASSTAGCRFATAVPDVVITTVGTPGLDREPERQEPGRPLVDPHVEAQPAGRLELGGREREGLRAGPGAEDDVTHTGVDQLGEQGDRVVGRGAGGRGDGVGSRTDQGAGGLVVAVELGELFFETSDALVGRLAVEVARAGARTPPRTRGRRRARRCVERPGWPLLLAPGRA